MKGYIPRLRMLLAEGPVVWQDLRKSFCGYDEWNAALNTYEKLGAYKLEKGSAEYLALGPKPVEFFTPVEVYHMLPTEKRVLLQQWITENLERSNKSDCGTSYGLKHAAERAHNTYYSNTEMQGAMVTAGYFPHNACQLNWSFWATYKKKAPTKLKARNI